MLHCRPFLTRLLRICLCAAFAGILAPRAQAQPALAHSVQLAAKPNGATLSIELSQDIAYEASVMSRPDRLVIDLPKVMFGAPQAKGPGKTGPVKAFRYGLFIADRSRIVLDLAEPAVIDRIDLQDSNGRRRMVVTIVKVDRARFEAAAARDSARRAPQPAPAAPAQTEPEGQRPLVVIDPGHGGIDPGASAPGGDSEKVIVMLLAQSLAERLEKSGKVRVAMTRTSDVFVSLGDRVRFARDKKAALMISVHADTLAYEPGVRGASVYTLSERASDVISARLADSENKSDQIAGVEASEEADAIGDILFDLTKRETRHFSQGAARLLVGAMQGSTSLHKHPLKSAGFRVLTAPDVPSVLIEAGYLSSQDDVKQMKSAEWRTAMAESVAGAVEKYFDENATRVTNSAPKP